MEKQDFRKLSPDARLQIKKLALKMIQSGKSTTEIAELFNVTRKSLYT